LRLVLDASAAVKAVLLPTRCGSILDALSTATTVLAPDLFVAEVANALWKYVAAGELTAEEAAVHLEDALALVDRLIPSTPMAQEAIREAAALRHPAYDLLYAIAARREGCAVLTSDRRLSRLLGKMSIPLA
jgi:predicted nucleic acid-binding protein